MSDFKNLKLNTNEQGKLEAIPYIEIINTKAKEIAKKYNRKPQLYNWKGLSH